MPLLERLKSAVRESVFVATVSSPEPFLGIVPLRFLNNPKIMDGFDRGFGDIDDSFFPSRVVMQDLFWDAISLNFTVDCINPNRFGRWRICGGFNDKVSDFFPFLDSGKLQKILKNVLFTPKHFSFSKRIKWEVRSRLYSAIKVATGKPQDTGLVMPWLAKALLFRSVRTDFTTVKYPEKFIIELTPEESGKLPKVLPSDVDVDATKGTVSIPVSFYRVRVSCEFRLSPKFGDVTKMPIQGVIPED